MMERNEGVSEEAAARLRQLTAGLTRGRGVRHAVVAVGTGRGDVLWVGAEGSADGDAAGTPMTPDTPFFLASVTKLYIATTVLRLYEEGRVALDAPISEYLPAELVGGLHRWKGTDRTGEITVRHLLGHATGLPEYLVLARKGEKSLFDGAALDPDGEWGIREITALVRDCGRPSFPPRPFDGRRHTIEYSDTNFQLLNALIEAVLDVPLHQAFRELIFQPLGLEQTFLPDGDPPGEAPDGPPSTPAAFWMGDERLDLNPGPLRSFRDLYSTAAETVRFMAALVEGRVFDDPATGRLMTEHFNPMGFSVTLRPTGPGWPTEYGLGILRFRMPRLFTGLRQAPTLLGHTGVTGSWLFHVPDRDLILSGTVDQVTAAPVPYRFVPRLAMELEDLGIRGPQAGSLGPSGGEGKQARM
ncbi:MAG: class A beta-lactamase-related serine hydrolase [Gemmatimonadales bacterium]|nr:MAG: class A beta-lactamase-related serine hydrolase [Gemmatimonadales bacterium]